MNFNGVEDADEPRLSNWQINLYMDSFLVDSKMTDTNGVSFDNLPAGTYTLTETPQTGWQQTLPAGSGTYTVTIAESESKSGYAFGNTRNGELIVKKYYDANGNGKYDTDEQLLTPWKINISGIGDDFTTYDKYILAGEYNITEYMPIQTCWIATDGAPKSVTLGLAQTKTVMFGNLCIGPGGGLTLGFWSNKNGQALIGSDDLAMLVALNLKNANGSEFNPASASQVKSWLLSASATNMAYMLSAQLAAMELNVFNGKVTAGSLIWLGPNSYYSNAVTVSFLMSEANTALGLNGSTFSGSPDRARQEFIKTALDRANNNLNFIQSSPCPFTFN